MRIGCTRVRRKTPRGRQGLLYGILGVGHGIGRTGVMVACRLYVGPQLRCKGSTCVA